jgi:hypothetical protein
MQLLLLRRHVPAILFCMLMTASVSLWAADMTPGEILTRNLDAIGSAQARTAVKSRVVQGPATYRILVGGSGAIDGKSVVASEGRKSNYLFKVNASTYRGEQFICDGDKISVAGTYSDKTRSEFGNFVLSQDIVLRENLLGGVWSVGWPLLDLEGRKATLHGEGMKRVDGKQLLALRYQPKKNTDLDILLYFDPQTYQHMMTVYRMEPSTSVAGGETAMAGKSTRRYRIEERFSDFQTADGLTLPTRYDVRYTIESESGFTKSVEWEVKATSIINNISIDARSFQVH